MTIPPIEWLDGVTGSRAWSGAFCLLVHFSDGSYTWEILIGEVLIARFVRRSRSLDAAKLECERAFQAAVGVKS